MKSFRYPWVLRQITKKQWNRKKCPYIAILKRFDVVAKQKFFTSNLEKHNSSEKGQFTL